MADYRAYFDRNWLAAFELGGQDVTLTIAKVEGVTVQSSGGSAERKIGIHFLETPKGMVVNTTNATILAALYGQEAEAWIHKRITIYPTITQFGREMKDCIRVRPMVPSGPPNATPLMQVQVPPVAPVQTFSPGWPPPAQQHAQAPYPATPPPFPPSYQGGATAPTAFPQQASGYGPPPAAAPPPEPARARAQKARNRDTAAGRKGGRARA